MSIAHVSNALDTVDPCSVSPIVNAPAMGETQFQPLNQVSSAAMSAPNGDANLKPPGLDLHEIRSLSLLVAVASISFLVFRMSNGN